MMVVILFAWLLALIVLAIAWGWMDRMTLWIKPRMQSLEPLKPSRRLEIIAASLLALAVFGTMAFATDQGLSNRGAWVSLPTLLVWAGGLWLVPFRLDVVSQHWPLSLAVAVMLVLFWVGSTVHTSTHAPAPTHVEQQDASIQQGSDKSAGVTGGLGFLFWILLIGLTVAVITRYTSTWNIVALNS